MGATHDALLTVPIVVHHGQPTMDNAFADDQGGAVAVPAAVDVPPAVVARRPTIVMWNTLKKKAPAPGNLSPRPRHLPPYDGCSVASSWPCVSVIVSWPCVRVRRVVSLLSF